MFSHHPLRILAVLLAGATCARAAGDDAEFFEKKIRPLLTQRCFECHSPEHKVKGGLRLDSRAGWETGGDTGPALVPGKPEESLLIKAVRYHDKSLQMPPRKALTPQEVEVLTRWVREGAFDPRTEASAAVQTNPAWEKE